MAAATMGLPSNDLPMVPGVSRNPDGYLRAIMPRAMRPGSAPAARKMNGESGTHHVMDWSQDTGLVSQRNSAF